MSLHRAEKSDWDDIPLKKRSNLQKIASQTKGFLTLPNIVTLIGGYLVIYGAIKIYLNPSTENLVAGTVYIVFGRLLDIADGYIAEWTKTKSPVGEALDASVDKISLFFVAAVLLIKGVIYPAVLVAMLVHAIFNSSLTLLAVRNKKRFHPSRIGKIAVWFEWVVIAAFLAHTIFLDATLRSSASEILGWLSFIAFVILGLISTRDYITHYKKFVN